MVSPARVGKRITLEEFLRLPEIDEHPYLEYIDGRIEAKVSPQKKHGLLEKRLMGHIDAHSEPRQLGQTFPELRCTFAGRSIIPDVVFLLDDHIETDERGEILDPTLRPPDIHVEIVSPDQSVRKCREKLVFSTASGCPLGWLIDPTRRTVSVYRPGHRVERLSLNGELNGDPVLVGYRLPVAVLFGWLKLRDPKRRSPPPQAGPSAPGESTR
jgi:Uma2 family endonuclease